MGIHCNKLSLLTLSLACFMTRLRYYRLHSLLALFLGSFFPWFFFSSLYSGSSSLSSIVVYWASTVTIPAACIFTAYAYNARTRVKYCL
ncbi:hypothetical protein BOTBODRAFT_266281 [Botryobasidium botryosum FD-172 SS1]|uniref:Uncharacterized protein n=1 Tax=Botryobasidium botryosum (strain FD-172 SS1) TaxID=930990 RepID=A0A067MVW6_BOTB1|nr:hypothetical protein BOTBODRAFT_266281 [Botryobasidium botryosum FD-172 SS1]